MRKIDTLIFDLDGTLLNTLEDLKDSVNFALGQEGLKERSLAEIRRFVGNGVENLIRRSVGETSDEDQIMRVLETFKSHYDQNCQNKTDLYPGIKDLLMTLKTEGYKIGIVTNKHQEAVEPLYESFFKDWVEVAIGQQAAYRKKPEPDAVFLALQALESDSDRAIYIGDSEVDYETAKRAQMPSVLVTWGFRDKEILQALGGDFIADQANQILDYVNSVNVLEV